MPVLPPTTDGLVTIRPPALGDAAVLVAGRDDEFARWLGPGADEPCPVACIEVDGDVVGWIDHDADRAWLGPGEVNVGYHVFAAHRGQGTATRAVQLLLHHLAMQGEVRVATLLIHPENQRSLDLATRARFVDAGEVQGSRLFTRAVPATTYTDGRVTIRRPRPDDPAEVDADLAAKDDEQIDWLWMPGQRERWEAMTPAQQRAHATRGLEASRARFVHGPKWVFAVDAGDTPHERYVSYVDADLANEHVPHGEANISYSCHPAHRGQGYVSAAVRLVTQFLVEHTGAREAHIIVDATNVASRRVAVAVGAVPTERWTDPLGHTSIRHVLPL